MTKLIFSSALSIGVMFSALKTQALPIDPLTPEEAETRAIELRHISWNGAASETQLGWVDACRKSQVTVTVTDPKTGESRAQNLIVVRPARVFLATPVVILVPTLEGVSPVENAITVKFCNANIATIIADVNDNSVPDVMPSWGLEDQRSRYAIFALRTTIDYARARSEFDPSKIGILGLSLGGIMTSFIAGLDSARLKAIVTVVAGGDIPFMLAMSKNGRIRELRNRRMQYEKMTTVEEYERKLRETVRYDPIHFGAHGNPAKMLMMMSNADTTVPTQVQTELHTAFRRPMSKIFSLGHVETVIRVTYPEFQIVLDFITGKFGINRVML